MQARSADPSEPEHKNLGLSEGLRRSHLNNGVLEMFAQNMTEKIIQSFMSQMELVESEVDFGVSRYNQNQGMFAEELASAVMEVALREVCEGPNPEDHREGFQSSASTDRQVKNLPSMYKCESERDFFGMDAEMDACKEIQTFKDSQTYHPPLSQSGLLLVGSLDYPDAPPTTPLLPELERSRQSFARKLKGGLAKVFLPSPPPPTPKDKEDDSDSDQQPNDLRVELMEHLMHSLPTDDLAGDYYEVEPHHGVKMEAFAEALSSDIMDWVLSAKHRQQAADDSDLHLLAHQLAETIITSSLDEAKMLI